MSTLAAVRSALAEVADPEIPAISIVDLGVIEGVTVDDDAIRVELLPTFVGCPALDATTAGGLRALVGAPPGSPATTGTPCAQGQIDCFATFNVMSIVVQVDKTLILNGDNKLVTVWASTHMGS